MFSFSRSFKGEKITGTDPRVQVTSEPDQDMYRLTIRNVGLGDEGVYEVEASNNLGVASAIARLKVHRKLSLVFIYYSLSYVHTIFSYIFSLVCVPEMNFVRVQSFLMELSSPVFHSSAAFRPQYYRKCSLFPFSTPSSLPLFGFVLRFPRFTYPGNVVWSQ